MTDAEVLGELKKRCWIESRQHFGAGYIFERRARPAVFWLQLVNYVGLAVPVFIGGLVMTFGICEPSLEIIIKYGGVILAFQLLLSLGVLVSRLDDKLINYVEAKSDHYKLFSDYKELASSLDIELSELKMAKLRLDDRAASRSQRDSTFHVCDWEKRMGMRSALREAQAKCAGCEKVPYSMKSDDCDVCGSFKLCSRAAERLGL